jgi:hypothetical protein
MAPKLPVPVISLRSFRPNRPFFNASRNFPTEFVVLTRNANYAGFQTSASQFLKEDGNRSPQELEAQKQEHLKKQERGDGKWDKELASKGEENVKADREDVQDHDAHIDKLQKQTEDKAEKGEV